MKDLMRGTILGVVTLTLLTLGGCGENNEARIEQQGITPPGAAATSEDGLKVKVEVKTTNPYGVGPKAPPSSGATSKPAPAEATEN
jgi:hypothetical protein